eukprot:TRINITY_DN1598_c0_g1_i1.p1 TRINITY_DN1598_c0_g1~~TRINITY_DN1598_c0_g1_i1.p1  ORF type:complete len:110 (+),score=46.75 TRINITY_DN1598_c0_g1_i1:77-406(+)
MVQDIGKVQKFKSKKNANKKLTNKTKVQSQSKLKKQKKSKNERDKMNSKLTKSINKDIERQMIERSEMEKKGVLHHAKPPTGAESQPTLKRKTFKKKIDKIKTPLKPAK